MHLIHDTKQQGGAAKPPTDLQTVVDNEIKEWHFHIYFLQNNKSQAAEALALRDAILRLRRDGAFVAVPLYRVNTSPKGPHPAGSYEVWCPSESFSSVFSYLCLNHGNLSIFVHPLTKQERTDHDTRRAWIGKSWPELDLDALSQNLEDIPLQYASLKQGYSSETPKIPLAERRKRGAEIEAILKNEDEAAKAPTS